MQTEFTLRLSIVAPLIKDQLAAQSLSGGIDVELVEKINHGIQMARVHGVLTHTEARKAEQRLIKMLNVTPL